jgi:ABC-type transport system substrate-binding protein
MNWVVDKAGLLRLFGGPIKGRIAQHDIPNSMLPNEASYRPYATPGDAGSVEKAKAEMMQSKYDTNHDGLCDAAECKNVLMVIDGADPMPKLAAVIQQNMEGIGITTKIQPFQTTTMYTKCETATSKVPFCPSEGWYADFNDSVMGATSAQLQKWGYTNTTPTPNIDDQLNQCIPVPTGPQRNACYANVDKALMETAVPWVPWLDANEVVLTSTRVQNYHLDASTGWISLALVALANGGK